MARAFIVPPIVASRARRQFEEAHGPPRRGLASYPSLTPDHDGGECANAAGPSGEADRGGPRSTETRPGDGRGGHELSLFTSGTRECTCICRGESKGRGMVIFGAPFRAGSRVVETPGGRLNQSR